jgi:hypothetical protein
MNASRTNELPASLWRAPVRSFFTQPEIQWYTQSGFHVKDSERINRCTTRIISVDSLTHESMQYALERSRPPVLSVPYGRTISGREGELAPSNSVRSARFDDLLSAVDILEVTIRPDYPRRSSQS